MVWSVLLVVVSGLFDGVVLLAVGFLSFVGGSARVVGVLFVPVLVAGLVKVPVWVFVVLRHRCVLWLFAVLCRCFRADGSGLVFGGRGFASRVPLRVIAVLWFCVFSCLLTFPRLIICLSVVTRLGLFVSVSFPLAAAVFLRCLVFALLVWVVPLRCRCFVLVVLSLVLVITTFFRRRAVAGLCPLWLFLLRCLAVIFCRPAWGLQVSFFRSVVHFRLAGERGCVFVTSLPRTRC
ncbi:hypothetical protein AZ012_000361 [Citrobacter amalonaticus]|nr:hypothetical protein [Citrobacter amalonaticus]OUE56143.1 hypothetical protein AZ012_000361 [Citrobacter amalonaticus]